MEEVQNYGELYNKYISALAEIRRLQYELGFALRDLESYRKYGKCAYEVEDEMKLPSSNG